MINAQPFLHHDSELQQLMFKITYALMFLRYELHYEEQSLSGLLTYSFPLFDDFLHHFVLILGEQSLIV